jgi:hypothetical protein
MSKAKIIESQMILKSLGAKNKNQKTKVPEGGVP